MSNYLFIACMRRTPFSVIKINVNKIDNFIVNTLSSVAEFEFVVKFLVSESQVVTKRVKLSPIAS